MQIRPLDIDKTQEWLDLLHPYFRWLMLAMYGGMFLYINRMFIKDPILRKWVMASFEEQDGRASGKSITAFVFAKLIAFATVVAIVYAPNHILPEFFLISILTFMGSMYGIKVASKYFNGNTETTQSTTISTPTETSTITNTVQKSEVPATDKNVEEKKTTETNNEEIG